MQSKKLYRSRTDKWIAGVLAGLAEYTGHDPRLYRLLAIIGLILTGFMPGVLLYAVAWFLIPEEPDVEYIVQ